MDILKRIVARRPAVWRSLAAALLMLLASAGPAAAELRAGAAKVDITPDVQARKVPLGGYAARRAAPATGVHDPVFARALVLSEGAVKAGIVSVDLCFVPSSLTAEVVRRVQATGVTGLDAGHLLLAATHAHTAPDPLAMHRGNTFTYAGWTRFDPALLAFTAERVAQAIVQADRRQAPAQAGWATQ
ncbi:MAG TPA: neutral/alkaline non-lysosomal ceramidase N-terminal domain-containing protein, partial [Chthonomonadaceae bacterium]|nr:neutral/alkaline non-lysosomal ceramidase N-terminal domain-containing protein [Chthonomonadaceae bacterium]